MFSSGKDHDVRHQRVVPLLVNSSDSLIGMGSVPFGFSRASFFWKKTVLFLLSVTESRIHSSG